LKTWFPALAFFLLGIRFAELRPPSWLFVPLGLATALLAPLNTGCNFTLAAACPLDALQGRFAVWMFAGKYGYLPLFYLTALAGSLAVLSLARAVRWRALAWCGRNSLELFLVNAYAMAFVWPFVKRRLPPSGGILAYAALFLLTVVAHV